LRGRAQRIRIRNSVVAVSGSKNYKKKLFRGKYAISIAFKQSQ